MLYDVGTCPSGPYCSFVRGIVLGQLVGGAVVLLLAVAIAAHRRPARLIGLVVCGAVGGKLLLELMRPVGTPPDVLTLGIYGIAVGLTAAAVLLLVSVLGERSRAHPR
jgi:hypothetical protein